ncbi:transposase [Archangium primigenium]|uniref:transposase n=1 Tax=[Archangium] primigenium TaxID=2792470 RepID=UPI003B849832
MERSLQPTRGRPLLLHGSREVVGAHELRAPAPAETGKGLRLFYLPAYSPQLNDVEAVFQVVKHYELPDRSYTTLDELVAAVRHALRRHHLRLRTPEQHLCPRA